jgi:hypothetical protein
VRAYRYIAQTVGSGIDPANLDKYLADKFDVPIEEVQNLKTGNSDPSQKLVTEFIDWVGPTISRFETESYLINPFK